MLSGCNDNRTSPDGTDDVARQKDPIWELLEGSPREWGWFLGGLAGLAVVLWAFSRFIAWMRDDEDNAAAEQMMLTEISELHRGGDLSEEEYRSIKGRLLERLEESDEFARPRKSDDDTTSEDDAGNTEESDQT